MKRTLPGAAGRKPSELVKASVARSRKSERLYLRLDAATKEKIEGYAERTGLTASELLRKLFDLFLQVEDPQAFIARLQTVQGRFERCFRLVDELAGLIEEMDHGDSD